MVVISWNDSYTVHVESIDKQHKMMMRLINDLHNISSADSRDDEIDKALAELADYTKDHFDYEESFLRKYHYPFFRAHQEEHAAFFRSIDRIKKEVSMLGENHRRRLIDFMVSWLKNHIMHEDKQYVCFMLEHGVK